MSLVTKTLPAGVAPTLGPDATGVGHVFWYTVESPTLSLRDLRTPAGLVHPLPAQLRARRRRGRVGRRLRPAVPDRRRSEPAAHLQPAAQRRRRRRPRQQPERRRQRARVERRLADRSRRRADRIGRRRRSGSSIGASNGVPVYVEQVADVQIGDAFRVASLVKGTQEAVGGVVVARTGVNTQDGHRRGQGADRADPAGPARRACTIVPFYDRSTLIEQSVDTLRHALLEEIAAGHARARRLPDALPLDPDRHDSAAAGGARCRSSACTTPASRRTS